MEVMQLYKEAHSKSEISRLTKISRPKVSEIIMEEEERNEIKEENRRVSDLINDSNLKLKNDVSDYDRALSKLKAAANDDILGPSVRKIISKHGLLVKESSAGMMEQIASSLKGFSSSDLLTVLITLREIISITRTRKGNSDEFKRDLDFFRFVVTKGYKEEDMDFLIKNGPLLSKFREYQKVIDRISTDYGVSEPEAIFLAFQGLNEYYRKNKENL